MTLGLCVNGPHIDLAHMLIPYTMQISLAQNHIIKSLDFFSIIRVAITMNSYMMLLSQEEKMFQNNVECR
jgi:hypothetical protein